MQKHHTSWFSRFTTFHPPRTILAVFIVIFAASGGILFLLGTHAQSQYVALEAESGTISSPATIVSDPSASGGSAVKFGGSSSGGGCPSGWPVGAPCSATTGPAADGVTTLTTMTPTIWTTNGFGTWDANNGYQVTTDNHTIQGYLFQNDGVTVKASHITFKDDKFIFTSNGLPPCGTYFYNDVTSTRNSIIACGTIHSNFTSSPIIDFYQTYDGGSTHSDLKVLYSELDCGGRRDPVTGSFTTGQAVPYSPGASMGLRWGHYTLDHSNMHGCIFDTVARSDTRITNNYMWGLSQGDACFLGQPSNFAGHGFDTSNCDHNNGVFGDIGGSMNPDGTTSTLISSNLIVGEGTSAIFMSNTNGGNSGPIRNLTVNNNWLTGATYTVRFEGSTSGTAASNIVARNNIFVRNPPTTLFPGQSSPYSGQYGTFELGMPNVAECGSVWLDNGAPVQYTSSSSTTSPACH